MVVLEYNHSKANVKDVQMNFTMTNDAITNPPHNERKCPPAKLPLGPVR